MTDMQVALIADMDEQISLLIEDIMLKLIVTFPKQKIHLLQQERNAHGVFKS